MENLQPKEEFQMQIWIFAEFIAKASIESMLTIGTT